MPKGVYERIRKSGLSKKFKELSALERKAYNIWCHERRGAGALYSCDDFIAWYCREFKKKKWKRAHVARFDHDKPYSFDNIEMQEQAENNRERNERRGNPSMYVAKPVDAFDEEGRLIAKFTSKVEAAKFFGVSEKTVYNHCVGRTGRHFHTGKWVKGKKTLRFAWSS